MKRAQNIRNATSITYGGETVGFGNYGAMGSGAFANQGYSYAAYQRQVYYVDGANAVHWANLTPIQESPACYTLNGPLTQRNSTWGVYFYFGGPGGAEVPGAMKKSQTCMSSLSREY